MAMPWVDLDCRYRSRMAVLWVGLVHVAFIPRILPWGFVIALFSVPRQGIHNSAPGNSGGIRCGVFNCYPHPTHSAAMGYYLGQRRGSTI